MFPLHDVPAHLKNLTDVAATPTGPRTEHLTHAHVHRPCWRCLPRHLHRHEHHQLQRTHATTFPTPPRHAITTATDTASPLPGQPTTTTTFTPVTSLQLLLPRPQRPCLSSAGRDRQRTGRMRGCASSLASTSCACSSSGRAMVEQWSSSGRAVVELQLLRKNLIAISKMSTINLLYLQASPIDSNANKKRQQETTTHEQGSPTVQNIINKGDES